MPAAALDSAPRTPEQELIVFAAIDSVGAAGHNGLRRARVADEAGLGVEDIRRHFPTSADLAEAVVAEVSGQLEQTIDQGLLPADRLRLHLASVISISRQRPALLLVLAELAVWSRRDGLLRAALTRAQRTWRAALTALFEEGKEAGVWSVELDAETATDLIVTSALSASLSADAPCRIRLLERLLLP